MFLLVLGNSVLDTLSEGIQKTFIQSFSGHILVGVPGKEGQDPQMFGNSGGMGGGSSSRKTIQPYQEVLDSLKNWPGVSHVNPQIIGNGLIEIDDNWRAITSFFGVDNNLYQEMFPDNMELVSGQWLDTETSGVLLNEKIVAEVEEKTGVQYKVGDEIKVMAMGSGTKIIRVPLRGIIRFKSENTNLQDISFMDLSSLRYLNGMVVGSTDQIKLSDSEEDLMNMDLSGDLDSFFDDNEVEEKSAGTLNLQEDDIYGILGDTSIRTELNKADSGAWMYILLRLDNDSPVDQTLKDLNSYFAEKAWDVRAVDWESAAGNVAAFVSAVRILFNILIFIIAVVSVIIIMNTMVVSIMERTGEIGTMRALGARKSYIRQVFLAESLSMSIIGGLAGFIIGAGLLLVLGQTGVPSPHPLMDIIFGGKVLYPVLSGPSSLMALGIMVLVGVLSSLYPTAIALRIQPVKAMQS